MLIDGKISDQLMKVKIQEAENLNVTEWRGKRIAIRNESVRVFLLNFRQFEQDISEMKTVEEKLDKYAEMMMECGEAIELVKNELRIDSAHRAAMEKGVAPQSDLFIYLTSLTNYLEYTNRWFNIWWNLSKNVTKLVMMIWV